MCYDETQQRVAVWGWRLQPSFLQNGVGALKNVFKKENIGFILVQSLYQISFCTYCSFLVMYLQKNGFTNAQCGFAVMLQYFTCLLLQPMYGYITDTYISSKKFLMVATLISIPAAFLLPISIRSVPLAFLSIAIYSCFYNSNESIITVWLLLLRDERPHISYEITRGMASVFYSFFALGFGVLLQRYGTDIMFISYALLASALFIVCIPMPEVLCQNSRKSLQANGAPLTTKEVAVGLLHNRRYVLFLASVLFYQVGLKATKTFVSNFSAALGGKEQELGFLFFISALVELPSLYLLGRFSRRYKVEYSYLIIQLAFALNLACLLFFKGMPGLVLAMIFSGVAYIGMLGSFMEFVKKVTPRQFNSSAINIGMALTNALGAILGSYFGGVVIDNWGLRAMILFCAAFAVVAFVLFLPLLREERRQPPEIPANAQEKSVL